MINHRLTALKSVALAFLFCLHMTEAFSSGSPTSFLKFSTDFDAKCVVRGGVMIYISNIHPDRKIRVLLERWYMNNRTADRGRSLLIPGSKPEPLGCSLVSDVVSTCFKQ